VGVDGGVEEVDGFGVVAGLEVELGEFAVD
jgi:hypothetical protein